MHRRPFGVFSSFWADHLLRNCRGKYRTTRGQKNLTRMPNESVLIQSQQLVSERKYQGGRSPGRRNEVISNGYRPHASRRELSLPNEYTEELLPPPEPNNILMNRS